MAKPLRSNAAMSAPRRANWRALGLSDEDFLKFAAIVLVKKNPDNPFFAYLAGHPKAGVAHLTLKWCPANVGAIASDLTEWAWERDDLATASKNSMLWDCVFMSNLTLAMS